MSTLIRACEYPTLTSSLLFTGLIGYPAFALASHVLVRMMDLDVRQITVSLTDLRGITLNEAEKGRVLVGEVRTAPAAYVEALQDLHFRCLIHNAHTEVALDAEDVAYRHFSLNPSLSIGVHWGQNTPITFRLPSVTYAEAERAVVRVIDEKYPLSTPRVLR